MKDLSHWIVVSDSRFLLTDITTAAPMTSLDHWQNPQWSHLQGPPTGPKTMLVCEITCTFSGECYVGNNSQLLRNGSISILTMFNVYFEQGKSNQRTSMKKIWSSLYALPDRNVTLVWFGAASQLAHQRTIPTIWLYALHERTGRAVRALKTNHVYFSGLPE